MPEPALAADPQDPPRPAFAAEVDEELVDNVAALVDDGQRGMVLNLTADLHPADLARLLTHLDPEEARTLFGWLPNELAGGVLPELESARRSDLLDELATHTLVGLIDEINTDDAADVLGDLPDELAARVLPKLEDADEVRHLMGYAEDTAGGLMDAQYVSVPEGATVDEATEIVRGCAETVDPVYVVYVVDEGSRFLGTVSLMRLLLARGTTPVRELLQSDAVSVTPDVDQEEVARIMERYDLAALPVLTPEGRLLGRITIDDVVDVIREEAEEDLQRASGITGEEEVSSTVFQISKGRIVWLLLGLVGAFASGLVIKGFEGSLAQATVLAVFIPVVMAMAGNAGIQSSAISVQGLVSGDIWGSDLLRRLGKEALVALLNGAVLAGVLAVAVAALGLGAEAPGALALTVGVSLFIVIILATLIGAAVPILLARVKIDPALAMGPFITVSNDILGLTVYFLVASVFYL